MPRISSVSCTAAVCSLMLAATSSAHAHFKLLAPTSWVKEDSLGAPQKGFPCGPGGSDAVTPIPTSSAVTEFHAGDTIDVQWVDTIAHPGHFRIALAANRDDFKPPTITQDASCNYDETMVPTGAHDNVLADGVSFRSRTGFSAAAGTMFSQKVTLPNTPCDKCTLQVMQIMENDIKALSNCYYNHCADIKILPAVSGGSAGASGASGQTAAGTGGDSSSSIGGASGSTAGVGDTSTSANGVIDASAGGASIAGAASLGTGGNTSSPTSGQSTSGGSVALPTQNAGSTGAAVSTSAGASAPVAASTPKAKTSCSVVQFGLTGSDRLPAGQFAVYIAAVLALSARRLRARVVRQ